MTYGFSASKELFVTYSDADYIVHSDTMCSTRAYVVMITGGAQSATDAEYIAANTAESKNYQQPVLMSEREVLR